MDEQQLEELWPDMYQPDEEFDGMMLIIPGEPTDY